MLRLENKTTARCILVKSARHKHPDSGLESLCGVTRCVGEANEVQLAKHTIERLGTVLAGGRPHLQHVEQVLVVLSPR